MLRMTALFLLSAVFIVTGQYVNGRMKRRTESLRELIVFIEGVSSQIAFSKKNIEDIINDLSCVGDRKLKTICKLSRNTNPDFAEKWETCVEAYASEDYLKKDDKKILLSFGKNLGVTDLQGQVSNCSLHRTMLEKQLEKAESELKEKTKTNTAISVFLALAVIIIFY